MKLRYRLCDEDQKEYGGPEWVELDMDELAKARARVLERIERETGYPLGHVINAISGGEGSALGMRVLAWVAREQSGLRTPFKDFDIHTLQMKSEVVDEDEAADSGPLSDSPSTSETSG